MKPLYIIFLKTGDLGKQLKCTVKKGDAVRCLKIKLLLGDETIGDFKFLYSFLYFHSIRFIIKTLESVILLYNF